MLRLSACSIALAALVFNAAPAVAETAPARLPLAAFFAPPQFTGAVLSPDGVNVAMLLRGPEGNIVLAIKPTAGGPGRILAGISGMDINNAHWVNNHRLVYSALRPSAVEGERARGPGLHGIDIDGSKHVYLVAHDWQGGTRGALPPNTVYLSNVHDDSSNDIYVARYDVFVEDFEGYTVLRMNTLSGNLTRVDVPVDVHRVLIDGKGVPRVAITFKDGLSHILYKDMQSDDWRDIGSSDGKSRQAISPALVTGSGELYAMSNNGHDKSGMYRVDTGTGKLDPAPVLELKNYDFSGNMLLSPDGATVIGVRYMSSEAITKWFDPAMQRLQGLIDTALPSAINEISFSRHAFDAGTAAVGAMLVYSYSDTEPGFWQLYDSNKNSFTKLGTRMPGISPLQMSSMKMVRYLARDGREIPAYLTMPRGVTGKAPLVVLVHGGPWMRGATLQWQSEVQFLASRGYAVLQPEYRGSTGFGYEHFAAGWRQWGKAMQDDVADGASWAIRQGLADGARVCIAGASYGGYATLMGLVNNPELFKCGIDWVGVTDLNLLYDLRFTNTSQEAKQYGLPALIGDQKRDAAMLKAMSPLENAARISQPLLLAYGGRDGTVPIEHGRKFYAAVKKTNPAVEWVEYEQEGHGWFYDRDKLDFWGRVERFLDRNLQVKPAP